MYGIIGIKHILYLLMTSKRMYSLSCIKDVFIKLHNGVVTHKEK